MPRWARGPHVIAWNSTQSNRHEYTTLLSSSQLLARKPHASAWQMFSARPPIATIWCDGVCAFFGLRAFQETPRPTTLSLSSSPPCARSSRNSVVKCGPPRCTSSSGDGFRPIVSHLPVLPDLRNVASSAFSKKSTLPHVCGSGPPCGEALLAVLFSETVSPPASEAKTRNTIELTVSLLRRKA